MRVYRARRVTLLLGSIVAVIIFAILIWSRQWIQYPRETHPEPYVQWLIDAFAVVQPVFIALMIGFYFWWFIRLLRYRLYADEVGLRRGDNGMAISWDEIADMHYEWGRGLELRTTDNARRFIVSDSTEDVSQLGEEILRRCESRMPGVAAPLPFAVGSNPVVRLFIAVVLYIEGMISFRVLEKNPETGIYWVIAFVLTSLVFGTYYGRGEHRNPGYCRINGSQLRIFSSGVLQYFQLLPEDIARVSLRLTSVGLIIVLTTTEQHENKEIKLTSFGGRTFEVYRTIQQWARQGAG